MTWVCVNRAEVDREIGGARKRVQRVGDIIGGETWTVRGVQSVPVLSVTRCACGWFPETSSCLATRKVPLDHGSPITVSDDDMEKNKNKK